MAIHNDFGNKGEQLAASFLQKQGYTICCKNYRYLKAEIDIIAKKGNVLVIVEVKSRSSKFLENIAETVTSKKIKLLVVATDHYIVENDLDVEVRFDIITVFKKQNKIEIEHLENAFYHF